MQPLPQPTPQRDPQAVLVVACNEAGVSRIARRLGTGHGHGVRTSPTCSAALDVLRQRPVDVVVVERDAVDEAAIEFLRRVRGAGYCPTTVLITPLEPHVLTAAINDAQVTGVVCAGDDLPRIVAEVEALVQRGAADAPELASMRGRCEALESKLDRLVTETVHRERAAHLLHDILAEIGHATETKEVAGRCLARVATMLRLNTAFIALAGNDGDAGRQRVFSFGCPRGLLDPLRELCWHDVVATAGEDDGARDLLELVGQSAAARLTRVMRVNAVPGLIVLPLRARRSAIGLLGLGLRDGRDSSPANRTRWEPLKPVAKQIAIAVENLQLIDHSRAAEAFATGVLMHLPSTVVVCNLSGRVLRCYDARQRLFGTRPLQGIALRELLCDESCEELLTQIGNVSRGGDPLCLRALRLRLPAGERLVNASVATLSGHDVMLILDDVTQRESMAGDLRRARALTSSLFAHASAGVLFVRHGGEIIDVNTRACGIFKRPRAELLGNDLGALYPDLWQAIRRESGAERGDVSFRVRGDERAVVSVSTARLGRPGGPAGLLVQLEDVGELQQLRQDLRRKDDLALMGQMVSFIAHEIKNPLFGISSAAQVLARETGDEDGHPIASAMLSEIERLSQLLEELLVFGSQRSFEPVPTDPTHLCNEIATMHRELLAERSVSLELHLREPAEPLLVEPDRLRQVLVNLLANAADATEDGGVIAISAQSLGDDYVVSVANSGVPIPAADQERIFDLFYTTKRGGSGLGLPICRKIVEAHGGRIVLHSTEDERTVFSVIIPASRAERTERTE